MDGIASEHFTEINGKPRERSHCLNLDVLDLPAVDASSLERAFSDDDVWTAISALPPDKAPGPDGFSLRFYQACWPTIKDVVLKAI